MDSCNDFKQKSHEQPALAINQQYKLLQSAINIYLELTRGD